MKKNKRYSTQLILALLVAVIAKFFRIFMQLNLWELL